MPGGLKKQNRAMGEVGFATKREKRTNFGRVVFSSEKWCRKVLRVELPEEEIYEVCAFHGVCFSWKRRGWSRNRVRSCWGRESNRSWEDLPLLTFTAGNMFPVFPGTSVV